MLVVAIRRRPTGSSRHRRTTRPLTAIWSGQARCCRWRRVRRVCDHSTQMNSGREVMVCIATTANIDRSDLHAGTVAQSLRLSPRYLKRIFADHEQKLSGVIRAERRGAAPIDDLSGRLCGGFRGCRAFQPGIPGRDGHIAKHLSRHGEASRIEGLVRCTRGYDTPASTCVTARALDRGLNLRHVMPCAPECRTAL